MNIPIIINNFLTEVEYEFMQQEVRGYEGTLSRDGYDNNKSLRDYRDPRFAETKILENASKYIKGRMFKERFWDTAIDSMVATNDWAMLHAVDTRFGSVLLSSYGEKDNYGLHTDIGLDCIVTAVYMFTLADKKTFEGGNLITQYHYPPYSTIIPFKENKLIIFPSCMAHSVTPVKMLTEDTYENRRFSLQYFISATPKRGVFPDESNN